MKPSGWRTILGRIPELVSWVSLVRLMIVESGNYKPFMDQSLSNNSKLAEWKQPKQGDISKGNTSARNQALGWHRVARVHHKLTVSLYVFLLIKYRLLALISRETPLFGVDLQYLDCFILGRFRFVGRTNKISGEVASTFLVWFLVYRLFIDMRVPNFKYFGLEFLVTSQKEIKQNESRGTLVASEADLRLANSISYLRCPFDSSESKWILRPNRTYESWLSLMLYSKAMLYCLLFGVIIWILVINWAIAGSIVTNLGFELSYPVCVAWLRDIQRGNSNSSDYTRQIYLAPRELAHEVPIESIPARIPLSTRDLFHRASPAFNLLRISFDVLENGLIYLEHYFLFTSILYMLVIHSIDINLNALGIKARLLKLIADLDEQRAHYNARLIPGFSWHNRGYKFHVQAYDAQTECQSKEIEDLQAILVDHFGNLTRGYNRSISFCFILMGLCWIHFTAIFCNWISSIRSRAVELEFILAESGMTMMCLIFMSSLVVSRSQNLQLYSLITRTMALDPDWSGSKLRWATVLKYFHPRSLYCFTIGGGHEISSLLCLKLLFWIMSAFCVLANFFYMYRN